jgi:PAS domain S-box-containing protein
MVKLDSNKCEMPSQNNGQKEKGADMHHVFMQSPVPICIFRGSDYILEFANSFYLDLLGKTPKIIGKPIFDSFPELKNQGLKELLDTVIANGKPYHINEHELFMDTDKGKKQCFFNCAYQPLIELDGTITGTIVVFTEVTEQVIARKAIEDSEKRYNMMLMQSPFAFAILKGENRIVSLANDSIKQIWGKGDDVEGKSFFDILPEINDQGFPELLDKVFSTGVPFYGEEMLVKILRGGKLEQTYFNFVYQPYREADETISGVVIIAYEVTAQAVLNRRTKENETSLAQAVEQRTKELQAVNQELQQKNSELALSKYNKIFLAEFSQKFANNSIQKDFFNNLVQFIVDITGLDYAFVAQFKPNSANDFTLETVAFSAFGKMTENFDYSLIDGPCKEVIHGTLHTYAEHSRTVFPKSQLTNQLNIEGYMGFPLYDVAGQPIGLVAVMHNKKIEDIDTIHAILKIVAKRAELELERIKNQEILEEYNLKLEENNKILLQNNKELQFKNDEIEESKNKLLSEYSRSLIEASLDPLIVINPKGRITDMNKAAINVMGETRKILIDTYFFDYFTEPKKAQDIYEEVFLKGFVANYPLTIKDHKLTDVLFNGSVYRDEKGNVLGAVIVTRDITNQKKIEKDLIESLKEITDYKFALDASSIVEVTDAQGVIKYVNENFCKVSQYTYDEIMGNSHRMINSKHHSKEEMGDLWATISSGKTWKGDIKNQAKDGSFYWLATTIVPFVDDKGVPYQFVAIRTDVTEQKRIEHELIDAKVFAELTTTIAQDAKQKAEEATLIAENAVKAKQQFLSNMSHEIRTPMNAIIGFTKVMLKTELTAKQREYLTAVKMSGDSLIVLINDILDLAKVDAGKMTFERTPFKLAMSINAMLHLFEIKIHEKNLILIKEYDSNIPEVLLGDPVRLHQIIMNLLSNAVKFTALGHIKMRVSLIHQDAEKATIEFAVTDTGIGITPDKMATIFDNFQQAAQDTPRLYGGTGLGLAIVKQLVEPQGGTIMVKSKIADLQSGTHGGSTFSFILDFEKTTEEAAFETEIMALDPDIKNIKVLVVEDMALNQLLMKTILDDFGFDRDIANNGKIAIEKLKQKDAFGATKAYDIILMDLQMPEMNGFEATEYIRNTLKSKVPIIALTADVTTVDLAKCKAVGMNDYIAKPVDERLLYSKIVGLVKKTVTSNNADKEIELGQVVKLRCTNMNYLMQRTKSNASLMAEMIVAYLEQTPPLIQSMKQSFQDKDWALLHASVHKMMPSFAIMGINADFEEMAKKVMNHAKLQEDTEAISDFISQLEDVCTRSCEELREELIGFKKSQ